MSNMLVLSLPMRNWNQKTRVGRNYRRVVLSLPMRNWNYFILFLMFSYKSVLSLPMRNWNTFFLSLRKKLKLFWVYLWGIETLMKEEGMTWPKFWVYLWGIETRRNRQGCNAYQRFESTYEELKHILPPTFEKIFWGFESTYEELKLVAPDVADTIVNKFWVYLWGIETWVNLSDGPFSCVEFWVYLWGIETWCRQHSPDGRTMFWVYLWGIET